jgi:mono/diheme cytochrome c family protein
MAFSLGSNLALGLLAGALLAWTSRAAGPAAEAVARLPKAAERTVDFVRDVQPILEASCIKCHGRGKANGGWRMDDRDAALAPADGGVVIVPGKSTESRLVHLVAGTDPDDVMPQKGTRLTPEQVGVLRAWIDQGVAWPKEARFGRIPANNLVPRPVALPKGGNGHPLDQWLAAYAAREKVKLASPVDDRTFARRVFYDLVGVPPTEEEWARFQKDPASTRRPLLVERLLSDRQRYAQHWLSFWNDLLRNDYKGTGYIDGGRKPIHKWLYAALRDNKPYDQFVRELVNPRPESEGFTKGIVWRGVVNASMTPPMQAAQNVAQVFMGVNLKCASCHDSFIDDWQLSDCYGLAGIYADGPLPMVQCDKPTGKVAPLRFLFPELGSVEASAPRSNRLEQVARIITQPSNGRLSRTVVNRLWARLMGRGLVEPLDVMQNPAWDPDTLDWLAEDLVAHGWDLKRTIGLVVTSRAYGLPSVDVVPKAGERFVFRGPLLRRLTAEQFRDTLGLVTGEWFDRPEGDLAPLLVQEAPAPVSKEGAAGLPDAFWIWGSAHGASGVPPGTNWLRRVVVLPGIPSEAVVHVHADNAARVFLNGKRVRGTDSGDWAQPGVYQLADGWKAGTNVIGIEAVNGGDGPNPAGVLAYVRIRMGSGPGKGPGGTPAQDVATDGRWEARIDGAAGWEGEGWGAASVLGPEGMGPWSLPGGIARRVQGTPAIGQARAALVSADPLLMALGRPNREQVTTVRATQATTLQALELTNGDTLARLLRKGAERLVGNGTQGRALAERVFGRALVRPPTAKERALSEELLGKNPTPEAVEDYLWSVAMLPEFQFIR